MFVCLLLFFCRILLILQSRRSSLGGGGGGSHTLHPCTEAYISNLKRALVLLMPLLSFYRKTLFTKYTLQNRVVWSSFFDIFYKMCKPGYPHMYPSVTLFSFFCSLKMRSLAQPWPISEHDLTSIYTDADILKCWKVGPRKDLNILLAARTWVTNCDLIW